MPPGLRWSAQILADGVAFPGEGNLVRKATGYEQKLKPGSPASGSRAARTELPATIRAYQGPTDSSEEAKEEQPSASA